MHDALATPWSSCDLLPATGCAPVSFTHLAGAAPAPGPVAVPPGDLLCCPWQHSRVVVPQTAVTRLPSLAPTLPLPRTPGLAGQVPAPV